MKAIIYWLIFIFFISGLKIFAKDPVKYEDNHALYFIFPKVPKNITNPKDRATYLVSHFWDNYNFADTSLVNNPAITEQGFTQFLGLLPLVKDSVADVALNTLIKSASSEDYAYNAFAALAEIYLYDPESPYKNDNQYLIILNNILSNRLLSPENKIRPQRQFNMIMKNRIGTKANDFHFVTMDGKESNLASIKAPLLILFFNDPDCDDCKSIKSILLQSEIINESIDKGKLKILTIYPDNDMQKWSGGDYPSFWINGYDKALEIEKNNLYDLHTPSLYLLDKDKVVLLKNTKIENIEMMLYEMSHPNIK